jgi:glucokinase
MADLRGGIDLGGTKIQTVVVDAGGDVKGESRRPTPTDGGPAGVAKEMAEALRESAQQAGVETAALEGIGVGSPGDADEKTGVVSAAKNLPDWEGSFPLAQTLKDELGTEVRIGNDVQVATEAEFHLGAGREFKSLIGVFWGTVAPPGRSATWSSSAAAPSARAVARAAWRPTPAARRWKPRRAACTKRATRPTSSS